MLLTSLYACMANILGSPLKGYSKSLNISKALFGYYNGYEELKLNFVKHFIKYSADLQDSAFQPLVLPSLMTSIES